MNINKIITIFLVLIITIIGCSETRNPEYQAQISTCEASQCHEATVLKEYPPSTGKHAQHLKREFICENCHLSYNNHEHHKDGIYDADNEFIIVNFDNLNPLLIWNNAASECSYISCHGGAITPVSWHYETARECEVCHSEGSLIDPLVTSGQGIMGKHVSHVEKKDIVCNICHNNYKKEPTHMNGAYGKEEYQNIVNFSGKYKGYDVSAIFDDNAGQCNYISCHGNTGNINWYSEQSLCTDCHVRGSSIDPIKTNGANTDGKHKAHVSSKGIECVLCHVNYTDKDTHINTIYGKIENDSIVNFGGVFNDENVYSEFNDTSAQCDNITCHGGTGSINWYENESGCPACHSPGSSIDPLSSNGSGQDGKHLNHIDYAHIDCSICHLNYNTLGSHMDGQYGIDDSPNTLLVYFDGSISGFPDDLDGNPDTADFDINTNMCYTNCHDEVDWYTETSYNWGCNSCHNAPRSSRRQIFEIDGDFSENSGITSHHIVGELDPTRDQCLVCHDQSTHTQGSVRLRNADTGDSIVFESGNPSSLEPFCLSCHDSDGATVTFIGESPDDPFGDEQTLGNPPYPFANRIAESWAKSYGHGSNGNHDIEDKLTCMGTGEPGSGCHGNNETINAHGSSNEVLLSKNFKYSITEGDYDESNYTLCFDCHLSYPGITKEDTLGVKEGGLLDTAYGYISGGNGPDGKNPPYYIANVSTHFSDHNSDTDLDNLNDYGIWGTQNANRHWYHIGYPVNYRGQSDTVFLSCINCHDVHGSNTQYGALFDELNYVNITTEHNNSYGKMCDEAYSDGFLNNYPTYCDFNCHPIQGITNAWFAPIIE